MMRKGLFTLAGMLAAVSWLASTSAHAADQLADGRARPWQIGLQDAFSPVMDRVHDFYTLLLVVQIVIVAIVLGLLGYIIYRFNSRRNPKPSRTSHNTVLEVVWTAIPIAILVVIAVPSLKLLYYADRTQDVEMTLKVTGHQWYWSYAYPDQGDFQFDSIIVPDDEIDTAAGQVRLLSVDNRVVLPVNTKIQVLVTSDDVIHDWAVPSLGLKTDAIPGRVNETWVEILEEGRYFGMCSELCGVNHGFMPIEIEAVSKEKFAEWVKKAQAEFASRGASPVTVAGTPADVR